MALVCAHNACAAVTRGGAVFAWGSNFYGELAQPECGLETHDAVRVPLPDAPARMLAAGLWHQVAVLEDGRALAEYNIYAALHLVLRERGGMQTFVKPVP